MSRIMAWSAERESKSMLRRTKAGMAKAKAEGKQIGGVFKLDAEAMDRIREEYAIHPSKRGLAKRWGVSASTIGRIVEDPEYGIGG